jgi:hypothetical protein
MSASSVWLTPAGDRAGQHQPLGARQPDVAHPPVEHGADQARHVRQHVADIAVVFGRLEAGWLMIVA